MRTLPEPRSSATFVGVLVGLIVALAAVALLAWPDRADAEPTPDSGLRPVVIEPDEPGVPASLLKES